MDVEAVKVEIAKLELEPGDTLLVRCNTPYPFHRLNEIQKYFSNMLPKGISVVVYTQEIEFSILKEKNDDL